MAARRPGPLFYKRPDAVLFDWDDTLFDFHPVAMQLNRAVLNRYAPTATLTAEELNTTWHKGGAIREEMCRKVFNRTPAEMMSLFSDVYLSLPNRKVALMPHAKAVLNALKEKKIRIGVVSNKPESVLKAEIAALGLTSYFDVVVGQHANPKKMKPDPTPIVEAVTALGIPFENLWFVGDSIDDVMAARACAIQRFHVHHCEDRRKHVQLRAEPNDPAGDVIYLNNLNEFHKHAVKHIPAKHGLGI